MQKILVFGAQGMFGHVATQYLKQSGYYQVIPCIRRSEEGEEIAVDITDFPRVAEILREQKPDIVLNCIGMLVQACVEHLDTAILVNSYFPHYLARLGRELNFKLIHISTDCVFSGQKGNYQDTDFRDGDTPYARTKALGEVIDERNLTIRTSIIGPELKNNGTGLFLWFMQQHGTIKGYTRAFWSGITTLELAKCVHSTIQHQLTGLFQVGMDEKISKFALLNLLKTLWHKEDITIQPFDDFFCDKSIRRSDTMPDYCLPANYRTMLLELKNWMDNNA